jgi:hypothetical protein
MFTLLRRDVSVTLTERSYPFIKDSPSHFLVNQYFICARIGILTVSFGSGYEELAHTYYELVYAKDVVNMSKVYVNMIFDYLGLLGSDVRI